MYKKSATNVGKARNLACEIKIKTLLDKKMYAWKHKKCQEDMWRKMKRRTRDLIYEIQTSRMSCKHVTLQ
jgi:hypothetical protein